METLIPFTAHSDPIEVFADLSLQGKRIDFRFELHDSAKLALDSLKPGVWGPASIERADHLWKTTCFEAFWAVPGENSYWEINLSPQGRLWNCYFFQTYRSPVPPISSHDFEIDSIKVGEQALECSLLGRKELKRVEASLCVIVRTKKATHFFANSHKNQAPDFHARTSFVLQR